MQPLLILQVPNTPDPDEIGLALDAIAEVIPEHPAGATCGTCSETTSR